MSHHVTALIPECRRGWPFTNPVPFAGRISSDTLLGMATALLTKARIRAGMTGAELARRSGTSRPTLSAYEHGHVSPTLDTAERVLEATGHRLAIVQRPKWRQVPVGRGRSASVPDELPGLAARESLRLLELPLHIDWSSRDRSVDLADRRQRLRTYEVVLREGRPEDIEAIVDGALLVDGWDEMVLPRPIRRAWQPLIDEVAGRG